MASETLNTEITQDSHIAAYSTWETAVEKLADLGFEYLPEDYPALGEWFRVPSAFKDATNTSAAVMVTTDGKAVHLYDHVEGCCHTICGENVSSLSAIEKRSRAAELERKRIAAEAEKRKRTEEGIENARLMFGNATPCVQDTYLESKHVELPGCRTDGYWLFIPLTDIDGNIQSLQRIAPDGTKRLVAGAPLKGSAYRIGEIDPAGTVFITEGASTGGSVYQDADCAVVCSMSAGNLEKTALDIRKKYPKVRIVIAGDDDQKSVINTGRKKSIAAANAVNGFILLPSFCDTCNGSCTDHNDVAICKRKISCLTK
jgi:putative DNA primase/helicase